MMDVSSVKDKNGNDIGVGDKVYFLHPVNLIRFTGEVTSCHSDLSGSYVIIKYQNASSQIKRIMLNDSQIELFKKAFNQPLTWDTKTIVPIIQRQEKPCQVCKKMNDLGMICWWCGNQT